MEPCDLRILVEDDESAKHGVIRKLIICFQAAHLQLKLHSPASSIP